MSIKAATKSKQDVQPELNCYPFCEDMSNVPAPWFAFYGDVDQTLSYPDASMFDMLERAANLYPDVNAITFMGKATKFKKIVRQIRQTARAFAAIGIH
ncbi:MAG: hypothetical protein PHW41_05610 [Eubacteriales bacterium]|nr:hypothetical protein [Eubacteriales bacterium]